MTPEEKLIAESKELNLLIEKGVEIEVDRVIVKRYGPFGIFKKAPVSEKLKFTIQEPTLSTLDRLSAEQIGLVINEANLTSVNAISEAHQLTFKHCRRMARIVAVAVLGQDYIIAIQQGSRVQYKRDDKRLIELSDLFFHHIKPSRLFQYVELINNMSNLSDFINSTRLMSASRTTMPILVEQNKVD